MHLGVVFPQTEICTDPVNIRDYAQAAEAMGYEHLLAYDHVLGANPDSRPDWTGYRHTDMFHEPLVLFSYLAGITHKIDFVSGIIILPQRQTVLVAKQAAALDVLSGGRLRLGIGIGWNPVEYEALGENFHNRGIRSEEQIDVLRHVWTYELVTYEGRWHKITDAGLNPLPVQRPIPLWFGGTSDTVMRRLAKIGDGWFPQGFGPDELGQENIEKLHTYIREAGRTPSEIGFEPRISVRHGDPDTWAEEAAAWKKLGATHLSVDTMGAGFSSLQNHIDVIECFKQAVE